MPSWLASILVAAVLRLAGLYRDWSAKQSGIKEQKLEHAEEVISRVQLVKGAWDRLDDNQRNKLRERYDRK